MAEDKFPIRPDFLEKIRKRQKEREANFHSLRETNQKDEIAKEILQLPLTQLLHRLQLRELSATRVLSAYIAKALEVTNKVNCVTEFVPFAAELATELDVKAADKTAPLGPLHGLPFAVKDDQDLEGMDTTLGFAQNLEKPAKESAAIVKVLMAHGAIPFCKTNLPQSILSFGSDNPIYGLVRNGLRPELAPGGSSSGSASIVAAGGALVATGSDMGGSLRCPSHYHGLATLRATTNRLSERGMVEALPLITQRGVPGVITQDANTLALLWKYLTQDNIQNDIDPCALPIPWNEALFSAKTPLKIGYFTTLHVVPAFPDTQKTVLNARDSLAAQGHELVPFEMLDDREYMEIGLKHCFGGQGKWFREKFDGEPLADCMKDFVNLLRQAKETPTPGQEGVNAGGGGGIGEDLSPEETRKSVYAKRTLTMEILGRMEKAEVDLLLCPAFPHPAPEHGLDFQSMGSGAYVMIWNLVDFPSGVVRFGTETEGSSETFEDQGNPGLIAAKKALIRSAGMPINVQIIGKPFKEEMVLRALVELQNIWETRK